MPGNLIHSPTAGAGSPATDGPTKPSIGSAPTATTSGAPMKRTVLYAAVASGLVLSACGASQEDEAKTAISAYLMDQQQDEQMIELDEGEADCIAGDLVDGVGVDQLEEYGFLDEDGSVNENASTPDMTEEDAEVLADAMFDCADVMAAVRQELASAMGGSEPRMQRCLENALSEDLVRTVLVAT